MKEINWKRSFNLKIVLTLLLIAKIYSQTTTATEISPVADGRVEAAAVNKEFLLTIIGTEIKEIHNANSKATTLTDVSDLQCYPEKNTCVLAAKRTFQSFTVSATGIENLKIHNMDDDSSGGYIS